MIRTLIDKIRAIPSLLGRMRTEPVLVVALAMAVLTAYQEAVGAGLGSEDLLIFVAEGVLAWFARELVVPTAKIEGFANFREPPLEPPAIGPSE